MHGKFFFNCTAYEFKSGQFCCLTFNYVWELLPMYFDEYFSWILCISVLPFNGNRVRFIWSYTAPNMNKIPKQGHAGN